MAYIDKCFYFDLDNRVVPLSHPAGYGVSYWEKATVRWRQPEIGSNEKLVSVELWQNQDSPIYGEKVKNDEVCLTRENALLLAQKLIRAVNELDTETQMGDISETIRDITFFLGEEWEKYQDRKLQREIEFDKNNGAKVEQKAIKINGKEVSVEVREFSSTWTETSIRDAFATGCGDTEEEAIKDLKGQVEKAWNALKDYPTEELTPNMREYKERLVSIFGGENGV